MRIVFFTHSLASCWNHGNAHFLRGIVSELLARGHDVRVFEPRDAWSLENLLADHGAAGLRAYREAYPALTSTFYDRSDPVEPFVEGADIVIAHEWNDPETVAAIGKVRAGGAAFRLLFHDTHHRAVSAPSDMKRFDLSSYDGVLAFGDALSDFYRKWGWGDRVWTWHEAADLRHFHPPAQEEPRSGLVWIGNWGDDERSDELENYLFRPASEALLSLDIYGVRYSVEARAMLRRYNAHYHGWAPNAAAPAIFARHLATVHVPRRYYATLLPGIPTIRVFEALACGIPLLTAPWEDAEHLFAPGKDYLVARTGAEMREHLRAISNDPDLRRALSDHGLATVRARHSCAHRVDELITIAGSLRQARLETEIPA